MPVPIATAGSSLVVLDEPVSTWDRAEVDRARDLMSMALAEAGHPIEWVWSEQCRQYISVALDVDLAIPFEIMERARTLTLDALGKGYTLVGTPDP